MPNSPPENEQPTNESLALRLRDFINKTLGGNLTWTNVEGEVTTVAQELVALLEVAHGVADAEQQQSESKLPPAFTR